MADNKKWKLLRIKQATQSEKEMTKGDNGLFFSLSFVSRLSRSFNFHFISTELILICLIDVASTENDKCIWHSSSGNHRRAALAIARSLTFLSVSLVFVLRKKKIPNGNEHNERKSSVMKQNSIQMQDRKKERIS